MTNEALFWAPFSAKTTKNCIQKCGISGLEGAGGAGRREQMRQTLRLMVCQPEAPSGATGVRSSGWVKPLMSVARTRIR